MDTRLSRATLGLEEGDAHILRNAGGIVTEDALRSLLISHYLLETEEFMIVNHTDCGLMQASQELLASHLTSACTRLARTFQRNVMFGAGDAVARE